MGIVDFLILDIGHWTLDTGSRIFLTLLSNGPTSYSTIQAPTVTFEVSSIRIAAPFARFFK